MIGFAFKKFKFFIYSRFDTREQEYIGLRIDFNTTALKKDSHSMVNIDFLED